MDKIRLPKALFLHLVVFTFYFVKNGHADTSSKPLWTPEDTVEKSCGHKGIGYSIPLSSLNLDAFTMNLVSSQGI